MRKFIPFMLSFFLLGLTFQLVNPTSNQKPGTSEGTTNLIAPISHQAPSNNLVQNLDRCQADSDLFSSVACNQLPNRTKFNRSDISVEQSTASDGLRRWEVIPNIIRADGIETFRVEIDTNRPVNAVYVESYSSLFEFVGAENLSLRDDGLGADRIAGDFVYTSDLMTFNTLSSFPEYYEYDAESPQGLHFDGIARYKIEELDGSVSQFTVHPSIGMLSVDIPLITDTLILSPNIQVAPYLINIQTDNQTVQHLLHSPEVLFTQQIYDITQQIYDVMPDFIDFMFLFATDKVESTLSPVYNLTTGAHASIQINYTGTGNRLSDSSADYGSDGKLLSTNFLDTNRRGFISSNVTHEIMHQWGADIDPELGFNDYSGHYSNYSSVASLLGGNEWIPNPDGTFNLNCENGRNGAYTVSPLEKYMMGLIDGEAVPTLYKYKIDPDNFEGPLDKCRLDKPIQPDEIEATLTIEQIQAVHGPRIPGPDKAQRDFNIAFVAESHNRLLNQTELTFYNILAEYYTHDIPENEPTPHVGQNWVSIDRFFGEGTTWESKLIFEGIQFEPTQSQVKGEPGSQITHTLTVTNSGTFTDTFDLSIGENNWQVSAPNSTGPLPSKSAIKLDIIVDIPENADGQSDTFTATLTSERNNEISVSKEISTTAQDLSLADLTLTVAQSNIQGEPGSQIAHTLTVTNTGSHTDTFGITLSGNSWQTSAPSFIGPLAQNSALSFNIFVIIPAELTSDSDLVSVTVSSERNNEIKATTELQTAAVLVPQNAETRIYIPLISRP